MLKPTPLLAALLLGLAPAPAPKPDKAKADLKKIQGTWVLTSRVERGRALSPEVAMGYRIEVKGDRATISFDGAVAGEWALALDARGKPKAIDQKVVPPGIAGQVWRGIYRLEGDRLTLCLGPRPGARPRAFDGGQAGQQEVWKRVKR